MRRILDELERLKWLTQSPMQEFIEQERRLSAMIESPIQKMIKEENERMRQVNEASASTLASFETHKAALETVTSKMQQHIADHEKAIREMAEPLSGQISKEAELLKAASEPLSKHVEAINAMTDFTKAAGIAASLQESISSIAEKTGLDPAIREMQRQQSLISAIESPMRDWFRNQNRLEELARQIALPSVRSVEPLSVPFPKPKPKQQRRSAELFFRQTMTVIRRAEERLQDDECLVIYWHTEAGEIIFMQRLAYQNPDMLILYGFDTEGREHQIVCHIRAVRLHIRVEKNPDSENGNNRWIH